MDGESCDLSSKSNAVPERNSNIQTKPVAVQINTPPALFVTMTDDEKHSPVDIPSDDQTSGPEDDDYEDEKAELLSSREPSPTPSEESELDPEFNQPAPSRLKRFGLLAFAILLLWIAIQMLSAVLEAKKKPKVVYASRYSKEHKFRPAASPIITETMKDGRVKLRGAMPPPTAAPTPATKKKTSKSKKKSRKSKRKGSVANKRI